MKNRIDLIKNNLEQIKKDFITQTGVEIKDLKIIGAELKDEAPIHLHSEFLDDRIGLLSNNFKNVFVDLTTIFHKEEKITIDCVFSYSHKKGGFNRISILNKDQMELLLRYEIIDGKIYLIKKKFDDGCMKIVVYHNDNRPENIYIERKLENWRLIDIIREESNIKNVEIYEMKNENWKLIDLK